MTKAVRASRYGGPEVLEFADLEVGKPGPGQVRLEQKAIGLNFIDIYQRSGLYPMDLPFVLGNEAAGIVEEIGEGVTEVSVGDRVSYSGMVGAYAAQRLIAAKKLLPIPDAVSFEVAAASTLKGLTVYYLLELTWPVKSGETILFHAAAGGVGQLAVQWAKAKGATVIGTVGSEEKAAIARSRGCDHVVNIRQEDFSARVSEITKGRGVDVVYDSIGKDTFEASLDCLRPRGLMVSFGNSSGPVSVPNLGVLAAKGSLYVTRPTLAHYFADRQSEVDAITAVFDKIADGALHVEIGQTFALDDVAEAHRALEGRKTTGSTVLIP